MTKKSDFKYDIEYIKNYFSNFGYIADDKKDYSGCLEKLNFRDKDGYRYFLSFDAFRTTMKKGKPSKISSFNPYTIDNIKIWIKENNLPFSYVSGEYIDAHEPNLCFRCHICGEEWTTYWNYIETGRLCTSKSCLYARAKEGARKKFLTEEHNFLAVFPELSLEWDYSKNKFLPNEISPKSDYRAYWICSICGHNWPAQVKNRANGNGCPVCKLSWGEKRIESHLKNKNTDYIPQYCFDDCRGERYSLPFDFYLPGYNCCIEYQGEQHYKVLRNNFFGGEEELRKRKINDGIKEKYCKRNDIDLLIIPYLDLDSVEEILDNYLYKGG